MRSRVVAVSLLFATACTPLHRLVTRGAPAPLAGPPISSGSFDRGCSQGDSWGVTSAIRSPDAEVQALLLSGCRQSPTFRQVADAIGRTDGIVYVEIGPCPVRPLRGCLLHTLESRGSARYLWIRLSANADTRELVATMAHELQHAIEILVHREVRSQSALREFYRSASSRAYGSTVGPFRSYETDAALGIAAAVRAEVGRARAVSAVADDDRD